MVHGGIHASPALFVLLSWYVLVFIVLLRQILVGHSVVGVQKTRPMVFWCHIPSLGIQYIKQVRLATHVDFRFVKSADELFLTVEPGVELVLAEQTST